MATGTVKWFNGGKGVGFINQDGGGADVFAHFSAISGNGFRRLEKNQRVEFDIAQGPPFGVSSITNVQVRLRCPVACGPCPSLRRAV